jgi:hypothetical protein
MCCANTYSNLNGNKARKATILQAIKGRQGRPVSLSSPGKEGRANYQAAIKGRPERPRSTGLTETIVFPSSKQKRLGLTIDSFLVLAKDSTTH